LLGVLPRKGGFERSPLGSSCGAFTRAPGEWASKDAQRGEAHVDTARLRADGAPPPQAEPTGAECAAREEGEEGRGEEERRLLHPERPRELRRQNQGLARAPPAKLLAWMAVPAVPMAQKELPVRLNVRTVVPGILKVRGVVHWSQTLGTERSPTLGAGAPSAGRYRRGRRAAGWLARGPSRRRPRGRAPRCNHFLLKDCCFAFHSQKAFSKYWLTFRDKKTWILTTRKRKRNIQEHRALPQAEEPHQRPGSAEVSTGRWRRSECEGATPTAGAVGVFHGAASPAGDGIFASPPL
jgi:hypothetical protein